MSGYGMKSHVMLQFQNSFGTSLVTSLSAIAVTEASLVHGIEQVIEAGMYGRFAESPYHEGLQTFEGEITMEVSPISIGWPLKSALGPPTTTSDTNLQTHVFKPRTSDFDALSAMNPLTVEQHFDVGSAAVFFNLCGNTLTFNVANGELMTATLGMIGGGYTRKAAGTPTYPTVKPFKWDQFSGSFNNAAIVDITDLSISINNNLEARYTLQNTAIPRKIKRTAQQVIEVTGTMLFQSHSYYDAFLTQTEYPFVINFAGTSPSTIKFNFPKLRFKSFEPTISGPGIIEASFTAGAMYWADSATAMQITLTNTQALYT